MNAHNWPFRGARWWKFDFHTHTPASKDTPWHALIGGDDELTPQDWLRKYMDAGVNCVAVTDHNSGTWIDPLKSAYELLKADPPEWFRELSLFPGVEISVNGGVCVLGVEDLSREPQELSPEQLDEVETFIRNVCFDAIKPPLTSMTIEKTLLPRSDGSQGAVIRVDVERSLFVHEAPGGYFDRVGSSKRPMAPEFLARLFQQRSQTRIIRFDEQIVPDARIADLDPALVDRFRTTRTTGSDEALLSNLAIARLDEEGTLRSTVSGILMATNDPCAWLPDAYIQAVAYTGTSVVPESGGGEYQLDARDIKGPLDRQVVEACQFVVRNMAVSASKRVGRKDTPAYDITAVFEALVNAVAHRDYAMHGSKIRLRIFADRLELYSPGAIANTMTVESMPYRQAARNEALTSLLAKCPVPEGIHWLQTDRTTLMDRRGEGVSIILERSEQLSGKPATYELIDDAELRLTIPSAHIEPETD